MTVKVAGVSVGMNTLTGNTGSARLRLFENGYGMGTKARGPEAKARRGKARPTQSPRPHPVARVPMTFTRPTPVPVLGAQPKCKPL